MLNSSRNCAIANRIVHKKQQILDFLTGVENAGKV